MSRNWRNIYAELTDFISRNPQIKLGQELIVIPEDCRKEFYRIFDLTRSAFVEEEYPGFIERARPLCLSYLQAEKEIIENPAVSEIIISNPLRWFVDNPVNGVRRPLYDLLFDLLRDRINFEQFQTLGRKSIREWDSGLEAQCYRHWLVLSLTNLLKPNRFFYVNLEVGSSSVAEVSGYQPAEAPVREPEETHKISLVYPPYNIFIVPDILIYSTRISRFVALRAEPSQATWTANNASEDIEWRPIDQDLLLVPGLITINISNNLEDLALIRDSKKIARPDLTFVCREPENWYQEEWFGGLSSSREILNPRLGMYIISRTEVPEEVTSKLSFHTVLDRLSEEEPEENGNDIQILNADLDVSKLDSFINMLASLD